MRSLKNPTNVGPMPVPASAYSIANTADVEERMFAGVRFWISPTVGPSWIITPRQPSPISSTATLIEPLKAHHEAGRGRRQRHRRRDHPPLRVA